MIKFAFKSAKYIIVLLVLVITGIFYFLPRIEKQKNEIIEAEVREKTNEYLIVSKVIDGDTFKMSNGEKVRLLGIDSPEKFDSEKLDKNVLKSGRDRVTIKKLGEASSEYVRKLTEGKKVTLVRDPGCDDKDQYGRLLRYVYSESGVFINAKILEDGYANVYYSASISKIEEFKKLEKEAKKNKRGLWGEVESLR